MKRAYITAGAAIVVVAAVQPGSAAATPAEGEIVRTEIAKGTTVAPVAIVAAGQETAFYIQNLLLKPASSSGWHTHPGPEYSVVKKGTVYLHRRLAASPSRTTRATPSSSRPVPRMSSPTAGPRTPKPL